jgi:hypothetical protein
MTRKSTKGRQDLNGSRAVSKILYDGVPESRAIELALDVFWATATEEFKKIQPEVSEMASRKAIEECLAGHLGIQTAKGLLGMRRGPSPWNGFYKDSYAVKAAEIPNPGIRSLRP